MEGEIIWLCALGTSYEVLLSGHCLWKKARPQSRFSACHFIDSATYVEYSYRYTLLDSLGHESGVRSRDRNFWKHATHGCPCKSVLMEFPGQTHPESTPYCSSTQAHPNPVGSSSTIATWSSRRYYLLSCFCQDLSAHPGPPMKSWAHPKPTFTQWVWVGRGFGWVGSEIPVSGQESSGLRTEAVLQN
jgi:hypothetical protein